MKRSTTRAALSITMTIALAGGLAACGGEEEEEPPTDTQPAATEEAPGDGEDTGAPTDEASDVEPAPTEDATTEPADDGAEPTDAESTEADPGAAPGGEGDSALPTDPVEYASEWVRAWGANDRPTLEAMSEPMMLQQILGSYAGDENWAFLETYSSQDGTEVVSFQHSEDGRVLELMLDPAVVAEGGDTGVVNFGMTDPANAGEEGPGFPTDPGAYADELVREFGQGADEATLGEYAIDQIAMDLANTDTDGIVWTRVGDPVEAVEGQTRVTYESDDGQTLDLLLDDELVAAGDLQAVIGITWS